MDAYEYKKALIKAAVDGTDVSLKSKEVSKKLGNKIRDEAASLAFLMQSEARNSSSDRGRDTNLFKSPNPFTGRFNL